MKKYYLIVVILVLISACAVSGKFQPDEKNLAAMQQRISGITMEQLKEGMILYKQSCSSCHKLYAPSEFSMQKWEKTLQEMFPKAKIVEESVQKKVKNYLFAMSE